MIVEKDHFKGKDNGYYYLNHNGYNNIKKISCEIAPIEVILSKKNKENEDENENDNRNNNENGNDIEFDNDSKNDTILKLAIIVSIIVIIIIIIFIFHYKKSDLETEVMKTSFKYDE